MKVSYVKDPIDIILCMLLSILLLPLVFFNLNDAIRIFLGLPFILFIPGYVLVFSLFPYKKTDKGIGNIERIALSFGLSIAIVPLIGLVLNFTRLGIRLEPFLFSIFIFIFGIGTIGIYRWFSLKPEKRFFISFDLSFLKSESRLDKALTVIVVSSIIISIVAIVYVITIPKQGEQFTDFYLLDPNGTTDDYPSNIYLGENVTGILGIVNHEYDAINYTIEVWLLDQSGEYNVSSEENETVYNHMWFLDKIEITLDHFPLIFEENWMSQWEQNFSFSINNTGLYKMTFLLFKEPTDEYDHKFDYKDIAEDKIKSAYRELHLWIEVSLCRFYLLGSDGLDEIYSRNLNLGENVTGLIGIKSNEFKTTNFTVNIWLVNQTTIFNETLQENVTTTHNMWFMDSIKVFLNHTEEMVHWEQNYSVLMDRAGSFKLAFMLFTSSTEGYLFGEDYQNRAEIIYGSAQKELSIYIDVLDNIV